MLSDVEEGDNLMLTRLTPAATLVSKLWPMEYRPKKVCKWQCSSGISESMPNYENVGLTHDVGNNMTSQRHMTKNNG